MAKKIYGSTGGLSNEVTKMYASVGGLSDNVIKGYCSVGGLSKLFFGDGGSISNGFWFFYSTLAEKIIQGKRYTVVPTQVQVDINKRASGIAFYFFIQEIDSGSIIENLTITVSTDENATPYNAVSQGQTDPYTNSTSIVVNNDTWYYTVGAPLDYDYFPTSPADMTPNCIVNNSIISSYYDVDDIVRGFLETYVYTDDFAENYQVGQTYNVVFGDMEKTVRKALAIWLFKNITLNNYNAYKTLLTNFETIVTRIMSEVTTQKGINIFIYAWVNGSVNQVLITVGYGDNQSNTFTLNQSSTSEGYKCLSYLGSWIITESKRLSVNINNTSITYSSLSPQGSGQIGVDITTAPSAFTGKKVFLTNLGLKFA